MQDPSKSFSAAFRPAHHRRAHSEVNFRLPEDLDLVFDAPAGSFDEEEDLFSTYMDIEKLAGGSNPTDIDAAARVATESSDGEKSVMRPRHRHSNSVDSSSTLLLTDTIEAKKAMSPDKLAELWTIDPKRAKRYPCISHVEL